MTNSVPDERLRAAAEKLVIHDEFLAGIMALISTARDSAMREAAGLVCEVCRDKEIHGLPVTKLERNNGGQWWHRTSRQDISLPCHAWPIHERMALKGER